MNLTKLHNCTSREIKKTFDTPVANLAPFTIFTSPAIRPFSQRPKWSRDSKWNKRQRENESKSCTICKKRFYKALSQKESRNVTTNVTEIYLFFFHCERIKKKKKEKTRWSLYLFKGSIAGAEWAQSGARKQWGWTSGTPWPSTGTDGTPGFSWIKRNASRGDRR